MTTNQESSKTMSDKCYLCDKKAVKTNGQGQLVCRTHSLSSTPVLNKGIRRNQQCPCGSGKKYKKCCMKALSR